MRPFILIVGGSGPSLECGDVEESEVFIGGTGEDIRGFEVDRCNSMIVGISTYTGTNEPEICDNAHTLDCDGFRRFGGVYPFLRPRV